MNATTLAPCERRFELTPDSLRVTLSEHWTDARTQWSAFRWLEDEEIPRSAAAGELSVELPIQFWRSDDSPLLVLPNAALSPEDLDVWRCRHDSFASLLGVRGQTLSIESVGNIHNPNFDLNLCVNTVPFRGDVRPLFQGPEGTVPLLPITYHALQMAVSLRSSRPGSLRLAALARLFDFTRQASFQAGGTATETRFVFDEYLKRFRFEYIERAALFWTTSGSDDSAYSVTVEGIDPTGKRRVLPIKNLAKDAPLISASQYEHQFLSDDVAELVNLQRQHRNQRRDQVEHLLHDPSVLLPSGRTFDAIDLSCYSPRVAGFEPAVRADRAADIRSSGVNWYQDDDDPTIPFVTLEITQRDGAIATLTFQTPDEARSFLTAAETNCRSPLRVGAVSVIPTPPLVDRVRDQLLVWDTNQSNPSDSVEPPVEKFPPPVRMKVIIRDATGGKPTCDSIDENVVPWHSLEGILKGGAGILKEHQRSGIAWLWHHYQAKNSGVLLADDMGLGKTLQISTFLALAGLQSRRQQVRRPSIIVAPVILLENWEKEIERFFEPGALGISLTLHGESLRRRVRNRVLDLDLLREYDIILTNYETLAGYQLQLLSLDFNIAVFDEAQALKTPDTLRTRAARGLKREFVIGSTGTPVENRLRDLWTLFDVASPGRPFTTSSNFEREYESDGGSGTAGVRSALHYPSPASPLLRREKRDVLHSLPPKTQHCHLIPMTEEQRSLERSLTRNSSKSVLEILQGLQKLYQHPQLLRDAENGGREISVDELLTQSPKLTACIELLRGVHAKGEKALVFTLWTRMQELLARSLQQLLNLPEVHIVNGASNQRRTSRRYLDEFEKASGFSVLVLSPIAAGTGLTITAANHVIHYGRWWNPAKEDQATDRVYRIGQTKPVSVHYPVMHHPNDTSSGFDVKLHELVEKKRAIARDFLDPVDQLGEISAEELSAIAKEDN